MKIGHAEGEEGFTSLQFAVMAFLTMVVFATVVNVVAVQYQLGAVRLAVDAGARHGGAAAGSASDCEQLAGSILHGRESGLLRGTLGRGIDIKCEVVGPEMVAIASGSSQWWMGGLSDVEFAIEGRAVLETFGDSP
jgi:hypothetical protein